MMWSEIKVGLSYNMRIRKIEGDDREFVGFKVIHKNSDETSSGRNRTLRGYLFTKDGTLLESELITIDPSLVISAWTRTEEQKAKEEEFFQLFEKVKLLVENRIIDVSERLNWKLGGNEFISINQRKIELGIKANEVEEYDRFLKVLDKLYEELS